MRDAAAHGWGTRQGNGIWIHWGAVVILRRAATKDPRLLFVLFPAQWRGFDIAASPDFTAKQGNNRISFATLMMTKL
jgi:hypothetical protein